MNIENLGMKRRETEKDDLIAILNDARCLSKRTVSNGELAERILDRFDIEWRPIQPCGCTKE